MKNKTLGNAKALQGLFLFHVTPWKSAAMAKPLAAIFSPDCEV